jgi:hypothetical protein
MMIKDEALGHAMVQAANAYLTCSRSRPRPQCRLCYHDHLIYRAARPLVEKSLPLACQIGLSVAGRGPRLVIPQWYQLLVACTCHTRLIDRILAVCPGGTLPLGLMAVCQPHSTNNSCYCSRAGLHAAIVLYGYDRWLHATIIVVLFFLRTPAYSS